MSSWDAFAIGLLNVFSWPGILIPVAGTLLAMVPSFLPGLGNASFAVLAMVVTLDWEPASVLLLFGALTGGATFMGSITAILFNIPGSVSSTPALLDGYPLSQRGLTRMAIACAATASAVGSLFGVVAVLAILPVVEPLILKVGPLEMLLIGILGLLTIVAVPSKSHLKSACMVGLGLLFAMVGSEPLFGMPRWSLGSIELSEGIGIVPIMMGVFTISELIEWMKPLAGMKAPVISNSTEKDSTREGILSVFRNFGLTARSSTIGTLVGMVPGIGGTVAGFVAYGHAVQSSPHDRQTFGNGNIKGLIAPEAAVDAKDGGSLLPTLTLGLPGSEACVILLAVFAVHGLVPGTPMLTTHLPLTYTLILALLFSNVLTSVVGVLLAPNLSRLGNQRIDHIALPALLFCIFSAVQQDGKMTDLYVMLFFGMLGYFWRTYDWPRIPFVIAFVLGSVIEKNLVLTTQLISVGRINLLDSALPMLATFSFMAAMGWTWVKQSRRMAGQVSHSDGIGLGLVALTITMVLFAQVALDPTSYSTYALMVLAGTSFLSVWVVVYEMRLLQLMNVAARWLSDLKPSIGHGPGLTMVGGLLPTIFLLGIGPAVAVVVAARVGLRQLPRTQTVTLLRALLTGLLCGGLMHWLLLDWSNLSLESGWLTTVIYEWAEKR